MEKKPRRTALHPKTISRKGVGKTSGKLQFIKTILGEGSVTKAFEKRLISESGKNVIIPPFHHIRLGDKLSGKTFETKKFIKEYVRKRKKLKLPYKVLIIDQFGEYKDIAKLISVENIQVSGNGVFMLKGYSTNPNVKILATRAVANFKNGLLVVENYNAYKEPNYLTFKEELSKVIHESKNRNVSTIINCWSVHPISERIRQMTTHLILKYDSKDIPLTQFRTHRELIVMAIRATNTQYYQEYGAILDKYKSEKIRATKTELLKKKLTINVDLMNQKVLGVSESNFCSAMNAYAELENNIDTIKGMLEVAEKIKRLSKYY